MFNYLVVCDQGILDDIFYISTFNIKDEGNIFGDLKNLLINEAIYIHYNEINKNLSELIKSLQPKEIYSHYNVSHTEMKGEIDLLVDDTMIEFRMHSGELATTFNISQTLIYGYLMQKKLKKINNIVLYNPLSGEITKINTKDINFKDVAIIYYGHFKAITK